MRKPEQKLWDTMRTSTHNKRITLERVENGFGAGMPDVYCRAKKRDCWVELKSPNVPKRKTTRLLGNEGLSLEQTNWHLVSYGYELQTYVLIRDSEGGLYLIDGCWSAKMNEWTKYELNRYSIAGNWEQIFTMLRDPL